MRKGKRDKEGKILIKPHNFVFKSFDFKSVFLLLKILIPGGPEPPPPKDIKYIFFSSISSHTINACPCKTMQCILYILPLSLMIKHVKHEDWI